MTFNNEKTETIIIYGINPVKSVIKNRPKDIEAVYFVGTEIRDSDLLKSININKIPYKYINEKETDILIKEFKTNLKIVHQKVFAKIKVKVEPDFDEFLLESKNDFFVILDGVTDPNNLGAIIRNLSAFGISGLILPKDRSSKIDAVIYKTSVGELENINVFVVTNLNESVKKLKKHGFWIYGFEEDADVIIWDTNFSGKICCVMGGEGDGIRKLLKNNCDFLLKIPMKTGVQSLNVASSSAVVCYEIFKQKSKTTII